MNTHNCWTKMFSFKGHHTSWNCTKQLLTSNYPYKERKGRNKIKHAVQFQGASWTLIPNSGIEYLNLKPTKDVNKFHIRFTLFSHATIMLVCSAHNKLKQPIWTFLSDWNILLYTKSFIFQEIGAHHVFLYELVSFTLR
jgi:hypothetical protein